MKGTRKGSGSGGRRRAGPPLPHPALPADPPPVHPSPVAEHAGREKATVTTHLYLYGIVEPGGYRNLGPIGVDDALVLVLPEGEFSVAVSQTERRRVHPSRGHLRSHEQVLDRLMEECSAVLPFSFGTVALGHDAVQSLLSAGADDIRATISRIAGCAEVGLKVFWQPDVMRREVEQVTGPLAAFGQRTATQAERRNTAIEVGQVVEDLIQQWRERYLGLIVSALLPHAEDWRENDLFGASMLWNGSFLVRRSREQQFREALERLDRTLGSRLEFRYVAPLPPYNFVSLRLGFGS